MFKALVAAACVAVIAIAVMIFRGEQRNAEARDARASSAACAADLASLKPYRYETPESYALQKRVGACVASGLISQSQLDARLAELR